MKLALLLSLLICLLSSFAQADILFIDMNVSPSELATAQKVARERGEKLWIIPESMTQQDREQIYRLRQQMAQLRGQPERLKEIREGLYAPLVKKYYYQPKVQLENLVQSMRTSNARLTSMIVSSHHVGSSFGEIAGPVADSDLIDMLKNNPELGSELRSVYLWGCYTATYDRVNAWRASLPKLQLIAGFDGSAPSGMTSLSSVQLESLMHQETEARKASEECAGNLKAKIGEISSLMNHVTGARQTSLALSCGCAYHDGKAAVPLDDLRCQPDLKATLQRQHEVYIKYYQSEPGFEYSFKSPAKETLREYYTHLRKFSHCPDAKEFLPDAEKVIALILFNHVLFNAKMYFSEHTAKIEEACKQSGLAPRGCLKDFFALPEEPTRKDAIATVDKFLKVSEQATVEQLKNQQKKEQGWYHELLDKINKNIFGKTEDASKQPTASNSSIEILATEGLHAAQALKRIVGDVQGVNAAWLEPAASGAQLPVPFEMK